MATIQEETETEAPRAKLERAVKLRAEANEVERAAFRAALTESRGVVAHAADALGIKRTAMTALLRYRYTDIACEAAQMREAAGYRGGNPSLSIGR